MEKFIYQTKCLVCGRLAEWTYSNVTEDTFDHFKSAMLKHANGPHPRMCAHCNLETLHEVVNYGARPDQ
ncbi:MAG TPA: hypothetical protein VFZ52_24615 [Chryseolinea sp.]